MDENQEQTKKNMIEQLRAKMELDGPIEDSFWDEVLSNHKLIKVQKNEILIQYNSLSKDIFFILSGSFVSSQITENGNKKAIWFHFEDIFDAVGSPDSFFIGEVTKYEIKAMEASWVVRIHKKDIDKWLKKYSCFNELFINRLIKDFVTIYETRSGLLTMSSAEFFQFIRKKYPFLFDRLPNYYVAEFMGVTPEWFSKLQKKILA